LLLAGTRNQPQESSQASRSPGERQPLRRFLDFQRPWLRPGDTAVMSSSCFQPVLASSMSPRVRPSWAPGFRRGSRSRLSLRRTRP